MKGKFLIPVLSVLVLGLCSCGTLNSSPQKKSPASIADVYNFLKTNRVYYLATVEGDQPRVRPFGTVMLYEDRLYIQTGRKKNVSKQIKKNPKVELCAFDGKTWLRLTGKLVDDNRMAPKAAMLDAYPGLKKMYKVDDDNTQVLYFKDAEAVFNTFGQKPVVLKF